MDFLRPFITAVLLSITLLTSCKKENQETDYNPNIIAAQCNVRAEAVFSDIFNMIFKAAHDTALFKHGTAVIDTATVTFDSIPVMSIRVNYGEFFRMCPDGLVRKGSYVALLTGMMTDSGSMATVRFYDHFVQDMQVDGIQTIANTGFSQTGLPGFQSQVDDGRITLLNDTVPTGFFSWKSMKNILQAEGYPTIDFNDDEFWLEGTSSGIDLNGKAFSTQTRNGDKLVNTSSCNWFLAGKQTIATPGMEITDGSIDYAYETGCNPRVYFFFNGNPFFYDAY